MSTKTATLLSLLLFVCALAVGCGGGEPESEATWETHTAATDDGAGGEDSSGAGGEAAADSATE